MVVVVLYEAVHVFTGGAGKAVKASSSRPPTASATSAIPRPSPSARVTLGGHSVAASGQPILLLNPGLVAPGGQVSVQGSGFDPGATVEVRLLAKRSSRGTEVAMGKTNKTGSLFTEFTMPSSASGSGPTVVAQESGSSKSATAQLVSPAGAASASIVGKAAGQPGDTVTVSATGFGPGETVDVYWGRMNGTPAATLTADGSGSISRASVPVGVAPVGPTTLVLVGTKTDATATAPYQMLGLYPNTTPHPYAVLSGKTMTYTGSGFAPGEQVLIYFNASGGTPALTVQANSGGSFSTSFVVPFGLTGRQTLTAIGEESRAAVTTGFDVLPYDPSAQASTYGALPGTTISFYASGFAANEVVEVYLGRGQGNSGKLVSAFRVDGHGNAAAAGNYVIPNGAGPALYFTLVGQQSGGTATAKVSVTTPSQPVTVPSQPPYTLPPSLGGTPSPQPTPGDTFRLGARPRRSPRRTVRQPVRYGRIARSRGYGPTAHSRGPPGGQEMIPIPAGLPIWRTPHEPDLRPGWAARAGPHYPHCRLHGTRGGPGVGRVEAGLSLGPRRGLGSAGPDHDGAGAVPDSGGSVPGAPRGPGDRPSAAPGGLGVLGGGERRRRGRGRRRPDRPPLRHADCPASGGHAGTGGMAGPSTCQRGRSHRRRPACAGRFQRGRLAMRVT